MKTKQLGLITLALLVSNTVLCLGLGLGASAASLWSTADASIWTVGGTEDNPSFTHLSTAGYNELTYLPSITGAFEISFDATFDLTKSNWIEYKLREPQSDKFLFGRFGTSGNGEFSFYGQTIENNNWVNVFDSNWVATTAPTMRVTFTHEKDSGKLVCTVADAANTTNVLYTTEVSHSNFAESGYFDKALTFSFAGQDSGAFTLSNFAVTDLTPAVTTTTEAPTTTATEAPTTTTTTVTDENDGPVTLYPHHTSLEDWLQIDEDEWTVTGDVNPTFQRNEYLLGGGEIIYAKPISGAFSISFNLAYGDSTDFSNTLAFKLRRPTSPEILLFGRVKCSNGDYALEVQANDGSWVDLVRLPDWLRPDPKPNALNFSLTHNEGEETITLTLSETGNPSNVIFTQTFTYSAFTEEGFFNYTDDSVRGLEFSFLGEGEKTNFEMSNILIASSNDPGTPEEQLTTTTVATTANGSSDKEEDHSPATGSALPAGIIVVAIVSGTAVFLNKKRR